MKDDDGCTPLHTAARWKHAHVAAVLLEGGADPNAADHHKLTPLFEGRSAGVAKLLIDEGAKVDARDAADQTPLHWAAARGDAEVVMALLDAGADVNGKDRFGRTALALAREENRDGVIKILTDAAATRPANRIPPRDALAFSATRVRDRGHHREGRIGRAARCCRGWSRQVHRGPDDCGESYLPFGDRVLGFGHRRLSILDLSSPAISRWPIRSPAISSSTTARSTTSRNCERPAPVGRDLRGAQRHRGAPARASRWGPRDVLPQRVDARREGHGDAEWVRGDVSAANELAVHGQCLEGSGGSEQP